jgi:hypothetical protein
MIQKSLAGPEQSPSILITCPSAEISSWPSTIYPDPDPEDKVEEWIAEAGLSNTSQEHPIGPLLLIELINAHCGTFS